MESKENGRIDIRGLDKRKIELLKSIAKEKGFKSLNDFMTNVVDILVKNEFSEIHKDLYRVQMNEISKVQNAILEKLNRWENLNGNTLVRLENLEKITAEWLEDQGYGEKDSSS